MLIAQISDTHLGHGPSEPEEELNSERFRAVLAHILDGPNRPDMLVVSGDITDRGDEESFRKAAQLLADCPFPVWPMVGNHDSREALFAAFPQIVPADGFAHYVVDGPGLRIVLLDTLRPGRHGGEFCAARQRWLAERLDEAAETPTIIFMHHPPVVTGIAWMDPSPGEEWIARFGTAVAGNAQVRAIHCGHLHRPVSTTFRGILLGVTPSVAPVVALNLNPLDEARPDDRALITTDAPAYALHRWDGENLVTHYQRVGESRTLARYTESLQPMIREMFSERT